MLNPSTAEPLALAPESERSRVLEEWNATDAAYPRELCIHQLFEAQVERTPGAVAVVFEDLALTYAELNARANRLAHHLRERGVGPDARVAVCVERGPEMVVGLLAVLKAGGAYVPLDPAYPRDRLGYMVRDSAPLALLTRAPLAGMVGGILGGLPVPAIHLDAGAEWESRPAANPEVAELTPDHLMYVVYTSGSTGQPKGVMNQHRCVVNRLAWGQEAWGLEVGGAVLQNASFSFDVAAREIFWPLMAGGRVVMPRPEDALDPGCLVETIRRHAVRTACFVPSQLQLFLEHPEAGSCSGLAQVVCSGEALPATLARRFRERLPGVALHNVYGPSEAATAVAALRCVADDARTSVPIGRPISNTRVYVLDGAGAPVPVGVTGELYIGGDGVARGYLGRAGLTAERFVPDPFSPGAGARLYRTGDLGRWRADGTLEFLGRTDFQVKIRGFRIEPGEIEARLAEHASVREAVVLAREDVPGDRRLVAYCVGDALDADALRAHLAARLPEHMVPAALVRLDALPLTPNGKLDRKALPAPDRDAYATHGYEAPVGEVETALAEIWSALLNVERVGRRDNFFELGGHSLQAAQVVSRAEQVLGVKAKRGDLFVRPVLADFARGLWEDLSGSARATTAGADLPVPVRVTGSQRPLFLFHDGTGSVRYAQVLAWQMSAEIPVYAVPPLLDPECSLRTVRDMGARFVRMIRSVQPAGPYRLAGHSFGGNLAYEVAAQLVEQSQEIEFLGMIDSHYVNASERTYPRPNLAAVFRRLCTREGKEGWSEATLQELLSRPELSDLGALIHAGYEAGLFAERHSPERVSQLRQQMWFYPLAVGVYTPPRISVPVCLFEATEQKSGTPRSHAWRAFLTEAFLRVIPVPGTHTSVMAPDHVPVLGQALSREIARAARSHERRRAEVVA